MNGAVDGDRAVEHNQRHARNVTSCQKCWSRGRIVSALLSGAQGGCLPSMEPPNPVATTMDLPARAIKGNSPFDTGLYRWQREFMKGASWRRDRHPRRSWQDRKCLQAAAPQPLAFWSIGSPGHGDVGRKG